MAPLLYSLLDTLSVALVAAYLVTRTAWFEEALGGKVSGRAQVKIGLIFGLLGVYGTLCGTRVLGAVATVRSLGPLVGGLLGGPWAGLGAAALAGLHAGLSGRDAALVPGLAATLAAGLSGGIFHRLTTRRTGLQLGVTGAVLFALLVQILHQTLMLLLVHPFLRAWEQVNAIGVPMFLAHGVGMGMYFLFVTNRNQERLTRLQRDQYLGQKLKIEGELSVAREIQMGMVPRMFPVPPRWPGADLFAHLRSAREVGGDFYDFRVDGDGRLTLVIGDVSDKGVPAALFMAETRILLKGLEEPGQMPHELLAKVNRELEDGNALAMFVTLFCAKLDFATGELWFSNAGHNPPLILRASGAVEWLEVPPGTVLGALPGSTFTTLRMVLAPGDALVAYTDGVTEALDPEGRMFTEARLEEALRGLAGAAPRQVVEALDASVRAFARGAVQSDDVTLLVVRFLGQEPPPRLSTR